MVRAKTFNVILFIVLSQTGRECLKSPEEVSPEMSKYLDYQTRQAYCCAKKMRCCKKTLPPPNIELRAVIVRCPYPPMSSYIRRNMKSQVDPAKQQVKDFKGFDEDEPLLESQVISCNKKLILTMKIKNEGETNTLAQYIVVDHVFDPLTSRTVRLLNPYVIKLKQEHVSQLYGMKFQNFVNSQAREQVYNKHDGNYTGCNMGLGKPTCGLVKYKGEVIPFSEGFCCSCDAQKNFERQPESLRGSQNVVRMSDPGYLMDALECPRTSLKKVKGCSFPQRGREREDFDEEASERNRKKIDGLTNLNRINREGVLVNEEGGVSQSEDGNESRPGRHKLEVNMDKRFESETLEEVPVQRGEVSYKTSEDLDQDESYSDSLVQETLSLDNSRNKLLVSRRQVQSSGVQRRGGQNCADRYTPPHVDPESYHESAHCLRFSPVWYGVYRLDSPIVQQGISIQIFEKFETVYGTTGWKDLTNGRRVVLGTFSPKYQDERPSISLSYESESTGDKFCLDHKTVRLLIPEGLRENELAKYPECRGGPAEYLVVTANTVVTSGDQCDRAGVSFEAFYKQPNRCSMPRGTCLHHQPKHLWLHDKRKEKHNLAGCYFLKYHGRLSKHPVTQNETTNTKYLSLKYFGKQVSLVDVEINADFNAVLRTQSVGVITEVYVDSTHVDRTDFTIKLTNGGLLSCGFVVRINDCPVDLSANMHIRSKLVIIPPQNQYVFKLTSPHKLDIDIFHCSVEALNSRGELIALRRIRIQNMDRCVCAWHCLCACIGSKRGLKCTPMKLEHYHAAGFQGGMPTVSRIDRGTPTDDLIVLLFYLTCFILFTLLILGFTKGLIGLCSIPVGIWGLNVLLDLPKPMKAYYEWDIRGRTVVYDEEGWPRHPDTGKRVRNLSTTAEFCTNLLFFYTYPAVLFVLLCKKMCCEYCSCRKPKIRNVKPRASSSKKCDDETCEHQECRVRDVEVTENEPSLQNETREDEPKHSETTKLADSPDEAKEIKSGKSGEKTSGTLNGDVDVKRKPVIKVSIKGRPKIKSVSPKAKSQDKSSMEISDNPYYRSTDDSSFTGSATETSTQSTGSKRGESKKSSSSEKSSETVKSLRK